MFGCSLMVNIKYKHAIAIEWFITTQETNLLQINAFESKILSIYLNESESIAWWLISINIKSNQIRFFLLS